MKKSNGIKFAIISLSVCCVFFVDAQKKDSLVADIPEVVLTGQYSPQSIKKSLYKVEIISQTDIQKMAVNNVAEILNQSLNIMIIPDKNSGDSKANIMGLGAGYTKILVDNIPLVGDTGLGSNIDLTKIALENVERIEIVKGSMGVEFGNNAMAGVINIITKKNNRKKWSVRGAVQEETVGKEYNWVDYGKGRHIQSLGVSHNISEKWFVDISFNRNDFQGFWGEKKGRKHFEQDNRRGYEWQPKEQINPAFLLRYRTPKTEFFYKADYLYEKINYHNPLVIPENLGGGRRTFLANDRDYHTGRMLHHFNIRTQLFRKTNFAADVSYQKQKRESQDYIYNIPARAEFSRQAKNTYYQSETIYSRATLSNFLSSEKIDAQIGYEGDFTQGFASWNTASFSGNDIMKKVLSAGVFASAEINLNENWFLRPGLRLNFSDTFKTRPNFSLVLKNQINPQSEFRIIAGSSNRNPSFEELFTYFVDANHDIRGNENLKPETSYSGTLFYSLYSKPQNLWKWRLEASTMYLQLQDKIETAIINTSPLQFKYMNINGFQSWVSALSGNVSYRNFSISAGASVLGRIWELTDNDKYKYHTEWNASASYQFPKTNTSLSIDYKGVTANYYLSEDKSLGITQQIIIQQKGFSLLNASVSQKFWEQRFGITLGVRNIFNISEVRNIGSSSGAHGSGGNSQILFYGRSFFGKINFNF